MSIATPKVIFLDAVGTLFGIRGSVGGIYSSIVGNFGVETDEIEVDRAFLASFRHAPKYAFPNTSIEAIPQLEYQWWQEIARSTFNKVGVLDRFENFDLVFEQMYAHFATAAPWYVYNDVIPALQRWQQRGIELGIISNFDTRIDRVLELLELKDYFQSVTISSLAGTAKPDPEIFQTALAKHNCRASQAWHVGDSFFEDYQGAKNVGIQGFWLDREAGSGDVRERLHNLNSLG
jgi:putative hydrolase of the HAD superfamily